MLNLSNFPYAVASGVDQNDEDEDHRHVMFSVDFLSVRGPPGGERLHEVPFLPQMIVEDTVEY